MNIKTIIHQVIENIQLAQQEIISYKEVYSNKVPPDSQHEFLFFIKPEITLNNSSIDLNAILELVFEKLKRYNLQVQHISVLGSSYLAKYDIIAQHYGVINALSRKPLEYLSPEAVEKFKTLFGKTPDESFLLGSLEFINHFPEYTPLTLNELWQNSKTHKLAGGTYCAVVKVQGKEVYLINGFHPRQLIHFTEKGRSIVTFTLTGDLDWAVARNNFIGKTNPADALTGSLRNEILSQQQKFGLQDVSSSQNGFHLSAGPVEGLVELMRYCSDFTSKDAKSTDDFIFGQQLGKIFSAEEIKLICSNHLVTYNGEKIRTFDLTEEKNSSIALNLLKESIF